MEEEILKEFKEAIVTKEAGGGGEFIVEIDKEVIFSKKEMKDPRFPKEGEIVALIKAKSK